MLTKWQVCLEDRFGSKVWAVLRETESATLETSRATARATPVAVTWSAGDTWTHDLRHLVQFNGRTEKEREVCLLVGLTEGQ